MSLARVFFIACIFSFSIGEARSGYDANGVALGATEQELLKRFPAAHCKPLQWKSRAADRRCDDGHVELAGANARATFYLKSGRVQAYELRFRARDAEQVAGFLRARWGAPQVETHEKAATERERVAHKLEWKQGKEVAVLRFVDDRRRASLTVSRGDFEDEIYRAQ